MAKTKYLVGVAGAAILGVSGWLLNETKQEEGYSPTVYYDSGRVPTQGYGSTVKPDGTKVKITDPAINKVTAEKYLKAHFDREAVRFNKSLSGVRVSQGEYDVYAGFAYQFGQGAWESSTMLKRLKVGDYVGACKALEMWRFSRVVENGKLVKVDCRVNRKCRGVWLRQERRINKCLEENS